MPIPVSFIDLFSGIGGFRFGLETASSNTKTPVKCVFSSEIDKNARKIYEKNFGDIPAGDITKIPASQLPDFDILCAGFPCQDVSIAGKRKGLCGERTGLFFEIIRIAKEKQPRILFLENVKGLLSSNRGWDFARVIVELEYAGYEVEWQVCNSKDFGVPQSRERVFIIGHLRGRSTGQIFPVFGKTGSTSKQNSSTTLDANYFKCIDNHGARTCIAVMNPMFGTKKQNGRILKTEGEPSFTVTAQDRHGVLLADLRIRKFTPVECERLQGFPDNWTAGVSDSSRYKCLGNAVTVNVVEAIAEKILTMCFNGD